MVMYYYKVCTTDTLDRRPMNYIHIPQHNRLRVHIIVQAILAPLSADTRLLNASKTVYNNCQHLYFGRLVNRDVECYSRRSGVGNHAGIHGHHARV